MRRITNLRLPLTAAIGMAAGIACSYFAVKYGGGYVLLAAVIPMTAVLFILSVILSKRKRIPVALLTAALAAVSGGAVSYAKLNSFQNDSIDTSAVCYLSGTVSDSGITDSGNYFFVISNATADGKRVNSRIFATVSETDAAFCRDGYKVKFKTVLHRYNLFSYGKLNYNAINGVKYYCNVSSDFSCEYRFSPFGFMRDSLRRTLFNNADGDSAGIAFAMLTGNTDAMDSGALNAMRFGGVAHIFAVSGLHIGVIYGIFAALFKKLRCNKHLAASLNIFLILFYAGVCGFTVSSLRAVIMCSVSAFSKLFYKKYDALNSLSISALFIMLISPLSVFSAGFQLSFAAVAAIICLSHNISRLLRFLPEKINGAASVSLAAQAGTFPVMLSSFGYVSGAGLLLNILFVPILSVLYSEIFVLTVISSLIPQIAGGVIPFALAPLEGITSLLTVCGMENALIKGFGSGIFVPVYFIAALALSDKINFKWKARLTTALLAVVTAVTYTLAGIYSPINGYLLAVSGDRYGGGYTLIKSRRGVVLIVTENAGIDGVNGLLSDAHATCADVAVVLGGESCAAEFINSGIQCDDVYFAPFYLQFQPFTGATFHYEQSFSVCGVDFDFIDGYSVVANVDSVTVAVSDAPDSAVPDCDILISDFLFNSVSCKNHVFFNIYNQYLSCARSGSLSFSIIDYSFALRYKFFLR